MKSAGPRPLTERQQAVMERIDRRVPIKVIAQELGVSETRINQHIRALKDIYESENLNDLVESYRAQIAEDSSGPESDKSEQAQGVGRDINPYSDPVYSKSHLPENDRSGENVPGNDPGELVMSDVLQLAEQAPWLRPGEPRVVPRVLDGENAVLFRLVAIVGIAFGVLAAVVLTVAAAQAISEVLEGRATVPVDQRGFS